MGNLMTSTATPSFHDVIEAIRAERKYQKGRWGVTQASHHEEPVEVVKPLESYLVYMQHQINKAVNEISTLSGTDEALLSILKLTSLGVKCLQDNGIVGRGTPIAINGRDGTVYDTSEFEV